MELTAGHVWLMVAAALVLFMTPGLAFFYGGMTRAKAALNRSLPAALRGSGGMLRGNPCRTGGTGVWGG